MQVLLDDEWHAIHKLQSAGYRDIATSFGVADYSIPLTLFYKALADTVGLNEWLMRMPMLASGIIAPVFLVRWAAHRFERTTVIAIAWLLAISPMLVIFTRMARPYAIIALLVPCALFFAYRWWQDGRWRDLFAYAVCAIFAAYLHLLMAIIVLSPLLWFFLSGIRSATCRPAHGRRWVSRIFVAAAAIGIPLLCLLLPPILTDFGALSAKAGQSEIDALFFPEAAFLLAGSQFLPIVVLFFALGAIGLTCLLRKHRRQTAYVLFAFGLFQAALFLARPAWLQHGIVYVRYNIAFLPFLLIAVAVGITETSRIVAVGRFAFRWLAAGVAAALAFGSMLTSTTIDTSSYSLHTYFIAHADLERNRAHIVVNKMTISPFWRIHAKTLTRDNEIIGFAPWRFETPISPLPILERASMRRVLPAFLTGFCAEARFGETSPTSRTRMINAIYPGMATESHGRRATILVWQKTWMSPDEKEWVMRAHGPFAGPAFEAFPACEAKIRAEFGQPVYEDEWLVAFAARR